MRQNKVFSLKKSANLKPFSQTVKGISFLTGWTLIELLVSICLLGIVILGVGSLDLFSRSQFFLTDRKVNIQNEASYVLSHISKNLMMAIGDMNNTAVNITNAGNVTTFLTIWDDTNKNGRRENYPVDTQKSYATSVISCVSPLLYTLYYINNYTGCSSPKEVIATHVKFFNVSSCDANPTIRNCVKVNISTCWDPSESRRPCGSMENPAFNMSASVRMLSVSAR